MEIFNPDFLINKTEAGENFPGKNSGENNRKESREMWKNG